MKGNSDIIYLLSSPKKRAKQKSGDFQPVFCELLFRESRSIFNKQLVKVKSKFQREGRSNCIAHHNNKCEDDDEEQLDGLGLGLEIPQIQIHSNLIKIAMNSSFLTEIGPDGLAREGPVIAYTEKVIAEEQLQLRKYIEENYTKIRDVEKELSNLSLELKLTAGPKKAALEHMRKKIEMATEKIRLAKIKEDQARKAWEEASKAVKDEEAIKQKLCDDLNQLVQESSKSQYTRLEELKRRLEALNPGRASTADIRDVKSPQSNTTTPEVSSNPNTTESASRVADNARDQGNAPVVNGTLSQQPSVDGEGRGKKKILNPGRGRGNGIVPKGRGPPGPGWTGAGFE